MSAYKTVSCQIVDKESLKNALEALGLVYEEHTTAQNLHGYTGDKRTQTAEIIVRRENLNHTYTGASNDLGFKYNNKNCEYDVIISDYDMGCGFDKKIKQMYAVSAIEKALQGNRFNVEIIDRKKIRTRQKVSLNIKATKII